MTWIKICGITNLEDALTAVDAGADALGFVFYEKSPRNVEVETVRRIIDQVSVQVETVGVFVNRYDEQVRQAVATTGLNAVQLHLTDSSAFPSTLNQFGGVKHYLAFQANTYLNSDGDFEGFMMSRKEHQNGFLDAVFLDSGDAKSPGGTGVTFDWTKVRQIAEVIEVCGFPLVVAGGLRPENVVEAIRILKPWGVDVSSGVEVSPGKKDPQKIRAFVQAVRASEN